MRSTGTVGINFALPASRTVVLAGATGVAGREILRGLFADDSVIAGHTLGRRPPVLAHPRLPCGS